MQFLSLDHEERYKKFTLDMKIPKGDTERLALLYCLTASSQICQTIEKVYNPNLGEIILYKKDDPYDDEAYTICPDYSTPDKAIIRLAYNLYNGFADTRTTPHKLYADNQMIMDIMCPALELLYGGCR
jgi:hypothetical protein